MHFLAFAERSQKNNNYLNGLSPEILAALESIGSRTGFERLTTKKNLKTKIRRAGYWTESRKRESLFWSTNAALLHGKYFKAFMHSIARSIRGESRYDIIEPLQNIFQEIKQHIDKTRISKKDKQELANLLFNVERSLANLQLFYKLNPKKYFFGPETKEHLKFIEEFKAINQDLAGIIRDLNTKRKRLDFHWSKASTQEDSNLNLRYLDLESERPNKPGFNQANYPNINIRRALKFAPNKNVESFGERTDATHGVKELVIFLVHGTSCGSIDKDFYESDQQEIYGANYYKEKQGVWSQAKYVAQKLADAEKEPVTLVSLGWNGANHDEDRNAAGNDLAKLINEYYPQDQFRVVTVAHSHGGNVVIKSAQVLASTGEKRRIDLMVNLATPGRPDYVSANFKTLINVSSDADYVQLTGSIPVTHRRTMHAEGSKKNPRKTTFEEIKKFAPDFDSQRNDQRIYNLSLRYDNKNLGHNSWSLITRGISSHSQVPYCLFSLAEIIPDLFTKHKEGKDLKLNINAMADIIRSKGDSIKLELYTKATAFIDQAIGH